MEGKNNIARMKEIITLIKEADTAYFRDDNPSMTDREYDSLMEELSELEKATGITFADSPSGRVGGSNSESLMPVNHSKPMLSAKKTKSVNDIAEFVTLGQTVLSWKMDGLTLVLRYRGGNFCQAITRGRDGLVGEDVTHTVKHLRNIPRKVDIQDDFEVRGEGVISWADFNLVSRNDTQSHPRNIAAGAVRSVNPDITLLSHMDFYAFELIYPADESKTKEEQLDFMSLRGFSVVSHKLLEECGGSEETERVINSFVPEDYDYPVDGIVAEYNEIAYGRSLGATAHHENRMLALKWEDELTETTFRGVELSTTRNGIVSLVAEFDPVLVEGSYIKRANLHTLSNFESLKLGVGDTIKVYKANMIIPQVAENLTRSGTYKLPERCPCCGSKLEVKVLSNGKKNLYCPNEECIARNAQKIARFCDKDAMNIEGASASLLEKLMAYGFIKNFRDLYHLDENRERILTTPGFSVGSYEKLRSAVEASRKCRLAQFLVAVGIPMMGPNNARALDEYFRGSWEAFETAIKDEFCFFHIAGISNALSRCIYTWYADKEEEKLWRPVLDEVTFMVGAGFKGIANSPLKGAQVVVTGTVNGMSRQDITELLTLLGASVSENVTKDTRYLIVGEAPGNKKLAKAMEYGVKVLPQAHFARMLAGGE